MHSNTSSCTAELEEISIALKKLFIKYLKEKGDYPLTNPQVTLHRRHETNIPENCFYRPIVGFTLQGAKRTVIGKQEYRYGAHHITALSLVLICRVLTI